MGRFHRHDDGTEHEHDHDHDHDHEHDHDDGTEHEHGDHSGYATGTQRIDVLEASVDTGWDIEWLVIAAVGRPRG